MKRILLYLLELTAEKVEIRGTGERALKSGLYRSKDEFIALTKGERFPPLGDFKWTLIVSV